MENSKEVLDEVIIETKAFDNMLIFLIHGNVKYFDKTGNIIMDKITKQESFNIASSKLNEIPLLNYYKKAKEIHIQRQIVSKIIVLSKKIHIKDTH